MRTLTTTLLQIFCIIIINSNTYVKGTRIPDNRSAYMKGLKICQVNWMTALCLILFDKGLGISKYQLHRNKSI